MSINLRVGWAYDAIMSRSGAKVVMKGINITLIGCRYQGLGLGGVIALICIPCGAVQMGQGVGQAQEMAEIRKILFQIFKPPDKVHVQLGRADKIYLWAQMIGHASRFRGQLTGTSDARLCCQVTKPGTHPATEDLRNQALPRIAYKAKLKI